ncbi:hypothetical protein sscle_04g033750 [Sclerotinia sclerotiorum 1980 UF-70]|uniref:CCHC-type domain-containing protein n=1 Tax=Sclerotinia sclerotiorum (strain ATCC 18683 / 1980 / Ss-1) TaxID=665079 RepID=A0A1D9Q0Z1_SCLS1|nr:hypothetical protein sscle_04g033750 [Sclerotinia sclerotiorum 1980 UF-70]
MEDHEKIKKPAIAQLNRENWRKWFKVSELYIKEKGWGYALDHTMAEAKATVQGLDTSIQDDAEFKMVKAQSGAERFVIQNIGDMDNDLIEEIPEFSDKWKKLKNKYTRITPQDIRNKMGRLTTFKLQPGTSIEDGWIEIYTLRKQVVEGDEKQKDLLTKDVVLEYFIAGLPDRFDVTIEAIDAQVLTFEQKFDRLRAVDENATLRKASKTREVDQDGDTTMAMVAYQGRDRGRNRRYSNDKQRPRSTSSNRSLKCYTCDTNGHIARDCPLRGEIAKLLAKKKGLPPPTSGRKSPNWRSSDSPSPSRETAPPKSSFRPGRDRAYVAGTESPEESIGDLTT